MEDEAGGSLPWRCGAATAFGSRPGPGRRRRPKGQTAHLETGPSNRGRGRGFLHPRAQRRGQPEAPVLGRGEFKDPSRTRGQSPHPEEEPPWEPARPRAPPPPAPAAHPTHSRPPAPEANSCSTVFPLLPGTGTLSPMGAAPCGKAGPAWKVWEVDRHRRLTDCRLPTHEQMSISLCAFGRALGVPGMDQDGLA